MKKNSKRKIKNYENCYGGEYEYYGVFKRNLDVKIDVKRMFKLGLVDTKISDAMNKNKQTVYFIPKKKKRSDYFINIFRDVISSQKKIWNDEIFPAIQNIETPKEVQHKISTGNFLLTGILSHEEASIYGTIEMIRRSGEYNRVILSFLVQFIHQFMSIIESTTLSIVTRDGYKESTFSRNTLNSYIQGSTKNFKEAVQLESIPHYDKYDRLYKVWHFLKHNSLDLYDKIKRDYPDTLHLDKGYNNGDLAMHVLKIDFPFIDSMFHDMTLFFESFCEKVFLEDIERSNWDYSTYFINIVDVKIKEYHNPFGFPNF